MKTRTSLFALASVIALCLSNTSHAQVFTWNGSTTGAASGISNTWDTTTANWTLPASGGVSPATWPSPATSTDDASFGGTPGTVTLTSAVGARNITFVTGNYTIGADNTAGTITLNGTSPTITSSAGSLNTIGASIAGTAGLTKAGASTLQLRGANTYTGDTTVLRGTLLIGLSANRLPTATRLILGDSATNTSGVFQMNSRNQTVTGLLTAGTGTGNRVINSSTTVSTFTVNNSADQSFGGTLGGTGTNDNNFNFTKSGSGRLTLTGSNTFTGTATLTAGTLELAHPSDTIPDTTPVTLNGGTLDLADKNETVGILTLNGGSVAGTSGTLTAPSCAGKSGTVSIPLAGTDNLSGTNTSWLVKDTAGTLTLAAANTFTGNITISAGRLTLAHSSALGTSDPAPGGTLRKGLIMQGSSRSLWLRDNITIPSNIDFFVSSNSPDGGGINNESGNNEIKAPIFFSVGNPSLNIASSSGTLTISGNITQTSSNRTLFLGGTSLEDNIISGNIAENNAASILPVIKQGTGKWILAGTNTYKGDTTVNGGSLVIANTASHTFYPKSDASSNKITGSGTASVTLNGVFNFDLSDAALAPDLTSWLIVDTDNLTESFGPSFSLSGFTQSSAGTWKRTVGTRVYTFTHSDGRLVATAALSNSFASWLTANPPASGFSADSDNDGISNGLEHIFSTNPNSPSSGITAISSTATSTTFTHPLNPAIASDVSYRYEWSTNLAEWADSGVANSAGTLVTITPSAPVSGIVTVTASITAGPSTRLFVRIKASIP